MGAAGQPRAPAAVRRRRPDAAGSRAHRARSEFAGSAAGALYVGPGWDVTVLALADHLPGADVDDPAAWENTVEVQRYSERTIAAWGEVATASGASADDVAAAVQMARAQFTPDLVPADGS